MEPQTPDAEQAMTYQDMLETAPDVMSQPGQRNVSNILAQANKVKPTLDNAFKLVAAVHGLDPNTDFESRIKQSDTLVRKVAVHRKNGNEEYEPENVNDVYGGRFIAKTPEQKKDVIKAVKDMDRKGIIIEKTEHVDHGTYHAYHIDFEHKGVKGEIQVHDPHSLLESVVNHDIRAKYGEKPPKELEKVKRTRSQGAYALPAYQAQQVAQAIEKVQQMGGGK